MNMWINLWVLSISRIVIREAALEGFLDDPEVWFGFINKRNETVRRLPDLIIENYAEVLVASRGSLH